MISASSLGKGGFLTEPDRGTSRRRTEARCRRPIPGSPAELYTSPVSLFWLNYRHSDGRFAGVDDGLEFVSGHQLDQASTKQIPREMIDRMLGDSNLQRLR